MSEQTSQQLPGISGMAMYVPSPRVDLESWCSWTQNPWDKVAKVVGRSFRMPAPHENVYTMAANAVLRLIVNYDIEPADVGFLGLGTESSTDNAAGAVIVRGMVDRALEDLGRPRLSRQMEVPEFKHACLGGVYALKSALRYVCSDGEGKLAIVVSADIAEYERGSSGEQTQGAGAVAVLVERRPTLLAIDLAKGGSSSAYRGPDFRKPFARHFTDAYAKVTRKGSDFPVFSGRYSTYAYLDETAHAVEAMLGKADVGPGTYYEKLRALFFHRPYHHMPVTSMSFLMVRALARSTHRVDELHALCEQAGVGADVVIEEAASTPDLFAGVLAGEADQDPYPATSRAASALRRTPAFRDLLAQKMSLGADLVREMGNLYSAALPAWIAAGFEDALARDIELAEEPMVMVGYGSGDAAEALPMHAVPGWQSAAAKIGFAAALDDARDLTQSEYEALHDGRYDDLSFSPRDEFAILRVGDRYEAGFQDLGIEYYGFVRR
ncbi:MAG: hydroxymethylglutaryl-CoA synthase [Myxococcota bacterium]|nr:hydroxymethylglutaryl-CoA synthase [Myxococcota bacterium]